MGFIAFYKEEEKRERGLSLYKHTLKKGQVRT